MNFMINEDIQIVLLAILLVFLVVIMNFEGVKSLFLRTKMFHIVFSASVLIFIEILVFRAMLNGSFEEKYQDIFILGFHTWVNGEYLILIIRFASDLIHSKFD